MPGKSSDERKRVQAFARESMRKAKMRGPIEISGKAAEMARFFKKTPTHISNIFANPPKANPGDEMIEAIAASLGLSFEAYCQLALHAAEKDAPAMVLPSAVVVEPQKVEQSPLAEVREKYADILSPEQLDELDRAAAKGGVTYGELDELALFSLRKAAKRTEDRSVDAAQYAVNLTPKKKPAKRK